MKIIPQTTVQIKVTEEGFVALSSAVNLLENICDNCSCEQCPFGNCRTQDCLVDIATLTDFLEDVELMKE